MSSFLKSWVYAATREEQEDFAARGGTTRSYLYHIGTHRVASPELAARMEKVSREMHESTRGRLPLIYRTDLSPACRGCDFAHKALGDVAVRADFEEVLKKTKRSLKP
jgi:hypothetical protein